MLIHWVAFTFTMSLFFSVAIERFARRYGIVSKTSYRRKRIEHTPLLGGVAVVGASLGGFFLVGSSIGLYLLLAFSPLLIFGICDDVWEMGGRWKLTAQILCCVIWLGLVPKEELAFSDLFADSWMGAAVTLAFLIGTINGFNLIDGLDGQATLLGLLSFGAISVTAPDSSASWVIAAALAGFLLRNFYPARLYLGEVGGSFIGFALGALATRGHPGPTPVEEFVGLLFLFSLPFVDTIAAIVRRVYRGHSILQGDRDHIHHHLQKLQLNVLKTLFVTCTMGAAGALTYILASRAHSERMQWGIFVLSGVLLALIYFGILYCERSFSQRVLGLGRTLLQKRLTGRFQNDHPLEPLRAILIDLMPYFRELQSEGVLVLNDFLDDLAQVIENSGARRVEFIGSYSVTLLYDDRPDWSKKETRDISTELYILFRKFHCVRGLSPIPEGVLFCEKDRMPNLLSIIDHPVAAFDKKAS